MLIFSFPSGPLSTNCYLIACQETFRGAVIDPGQGAGVRVLEKASQQGILIEKILLTHSRWDHFVDAALLREQTGASIYVHSLDAENLEDPGSDGLPLFVPVRSAPADRLLQDGDEIPLGHLRARVLHTPGHSPGGVCYLIAAEGIVFSGDTLFQGTFGSLSLPTADPKAMLDSLKKLAELPKTTRIFPGHGLDTTIGSEGWLARVEEFM